MLDQGLGQLRADADQPGEVVAVRGRGGRVSGGRFVFGGGNDGFGGDGFDRDGLFRRRRQGLRPYLRALGDSARSGGVH